MRIAWLMGLAIALAGCTHDRAIRGGETITLAVEAPGICPNCASYIITLGPDGQGIFTGKAHTAVAGEHRFRAMPEQVRRFAARLQPYRPTGELLITGGALCRTYVGTHGYVFDVRWNPALRPPSRLRYRQNCDPAKHRKMCHALFSAPDLLPIADLIGKR